MSGRRHDAKLLVARQIAINDQKVWARLSPKDHHRYLTLAENIIATVERMMKDFRWE